MPWVAACLDLIAGQLLGYLFIVRKIALLVGIAQENKVHEIKDELKEFININKKVMAPSSMDQQGRESTPDKTVRPTIIPTKAPRKFAGVIIALAGLPARGKSQIAYKLARRLNWNAVSTKVMRVSDYRRKRLERYGSHELFRPDHATNVALRALAQHDAMQDCASWLAAGNAVAILDATLVTREQRAEVYDHFSSQLGYRVLFVECICNDEKFIEANCNEIIKYNTDYAGMDRKRAMEDVKLKIAHYEKVYKPMDETYPRIQLHTDTFEIRAFKLSGHVETSVLGYLGSASLKPHTIYFSRHGESEFNVLGKIGGDAVLSTRGERYAQALASKINSMNIADLRVLTSRLRRTIATAKGIEAPQEHVAALNELYAGVCEGLSYEEMQENYPQEFAWRDQDKLRYRYPWGESYVDTMQRIEPVIVDLQQATNVLVISHQAILRCIIGYFLDKMPEELPYMEVPLHTIIQVSSNGFSYKLEYIKLPVECVNTNRVKPSNCSANRTTDDALVTVPAHYDIPDPWRNPASGPTLVQQH